MTSLSTLKTIGGDTRTERRYFDERFSKPMTKMIVCHINQL